MRRVYDILLGLNGGPLEVEYILKELGDRQTANSILEEDQLLETLLRDDRLRSTQGYRQRFSISGRSVRLRPPGNKAEQAIEFENHEIKSQLLVQLREVPPEVFEHIVAALFTAMKYEQVAVTRRARDGGVDVHATLVAGGVTTVPTSIQAKRWAKPVSVKEVRELRGTLRPGTQGIIVTTGKYTRDAPKEASSNALAPIHLIDGNLLADLLTEHGIGVQASRLSLLSLDLDALATIGGTVKGSVDKAPLRLIGATQRLYYIDKVPSDGRGRLLDTIVTMIQLAEGQPSWDDYIAEFRRHFQGITRPDEARRRSRVLVSLGLVDIEDGHMSLTLAGSRLLKSPSVKLLYDTFLERIAGAREIEALTATLAREELRARLRFEPPAGLSPTQAELVEKWLHRLKES